MLRMLSLVNNFHVVSLLQHMVFRSEMGVDSILETWIPPEVLVKCGPTGFFGEDIDGNPIVYDNHGNVDSRGDCMGFI